MPVSSLSLRSGNLAKLAVLSFLTSGAAAAAAPYQLKSTYTGDTFFDNFDFYTGPDPNGGYVSYESFENASYDEIISYDGVYSYMGVDDVNELDPAGPGRSATKLISKETFNHGLFITEITNMPGGVCGTVPGYYLGGGQGEIGTISGLNDGTTNTMTLFTTGPFDVVGNSGTGQQQSTTCQTGCSTVDKDGNAYGSNFNDNDGGIFATQWDSDAVNIWFWSDYGNLPDDIDSDSPDPSGWGAPIASFAGTTSLDGILSNGKIVFDTNFCGTVIESLWSDSQCGLMAQTCAEYVAQNFADFEQQYWAVTYMKVYQSGGAAPVAAPVDAPVPPAAISSTQAAAISTSAAPVPVVDPVVTPAVPAAISSTKAASVSTSAAADPVAVPVVIAAPPAVSSTSAAASVSTSAAADPVVVPVVVPAVPAASSTSPSVPAGTSIPGFGGYTYYGCVRDIDTRQLYADHFTVGPMTVEVCATFCGAYPFFGLEYLNECYCGNEFSAPLTMLDESQCQMPCTGNPGEICGGAMALSVFTKGPIVVAPQAALPDSGASSTVVSGASSTVVDSAAPPTAISDASPTTVDADAPASTTDSSIPSVAPVLADPAPPVASSSGSQVITPATSIDSQSNPTVVAALPSSTPAAAVPSEVPVTSTPATSTEWDSVGCWGSNDGFSSFWLVDYDNSANTVEYCTSLCDNEPASFAAMYDGDCYCGDRNMISATTQFPDDSCDIVCPGDESESCGGDVIVPRRRSPVRAKRNGGDIPSTELLNIYAKKPIVVSSVSSVPVSSTSVSKPSISAPAPPKNATTTTTASASTSSLSSASKMYSNTTAPASSISTTVYPPTSVTKTTAAPPMTTSTVYATSVYTITSCAKTVTDCPALIGQVTTEIISLYTTICPVSPAPTAPTAPATMTTPAPVISHGGGGDLITTVIVTTYVDICPGGLTTIATSLTKTLFSGATQPTIPMTTSTATVTISGSVQTVCLTVPYTPTPPSAMSTGVKKGNVGTFTQPTVVVTTTMVVVPVPVATGSAGFYPTGPAGGNGTAAACPGCAKATAGSSATGTGSKPGSTGKPYANEGMGRTEWSAVAGAVALVCAMAIL